LAWLRIHRNLDTDDLLWCGGEDECEEEKRGDRKECRRNSQMVRIGHMQVEEGVQMVLRILEN
jgi:hypothetical protein